VGALFDASATMNRTGTLKAQRMSTEELTKASEARLSFFGHVAGITSRNYTVFVCLPACHGLDGTEIDDHSL